MKDPSQMPNIENAHITICDFCQDPTTELDVFMECSHRICSLCLYRRIFSANIQQLHCEGGCRVQCKCNKGFMFKQLDEVENVIQKKNEIDATRRNEKNQIKNMPRCKVHPAQFLDYYCVECSTIICKICAKVNDTTHYGHRIVKSTKIIEVLTQEIEFLKTQQLGIATVDDFVHAFNDISKNVKTVAEKHFSKIMGQIEELINGLIQFKNQYEISYIKELFRIVKSLKLYKQFYQNYYEDIAEGASSNDINFMRYVNNISSILSGGTIENNDEVSRTLNNLRNHIDILKTTVKTPITANFLFQPVTRQFRFDSHFETGHTSHITSMIQTRDERIITCSDYNMKIWTEDLEKPQYNCIESIEKFVGKIANVLELSDGRLITTEENGKALKVWKKTKTGFSMEQTLDGHSQSISGVAQLRDGRLVSCSGDGKIIIWKENDHMFSIGNQLLENDYPINVIITLVDNRIVTSGSDAHVKVWKEEKNMNYEFKCVQDLDASNNIFTSILQLSTGDLMMSIKKSGSLLWWKEKGSPKRFTAMQRISGHNADVTAITELRDQRIATSCRDRMIRLFKYSGNDKSGYILDLTVEEYIHGIYHLKQLKDGRLCAVGTDKRLACWRSRNDMY